MVYFYSSDFCQASENNVRSGVHVASAGRATSAVHMAAAESDAPTNGRQVSHVEVSQKRWWKADWQGANVRSAVVENTWRPQSGRPSGMGCQKPEVQNMYLPECNVRPAWAVRSETTVPSPPTRIPAPLKDARRQGLQKNRSVHEN
ncbi:hypothetical protein LR48_Vigan04g022700 [Vigna angularis]|uniref:Uncharacterized protein n=1 Tax=Phaseolus angularis TaxID=3914 RepID=A0A0L9UBY9_PHAAN|nr:hypothetical protein LR48_Vigan04g022700 [Vigna angularis]